MQRNSTIAIGAIVIMLMAVVGASLLLSGEGSQRTTITQQGSDTLLELMTEMSEAFNDAQGDVEVIVTGGGSSVGINALIAGGVDVAQASRQMKAS
ncbi:MAG TPA: substrate-binding domain-containing protein, partial [Methanomassiliicoccaceae archaeon]|nr:substrate-binding domain-containing protein [Methanomassiliicoccaceae archaeon]